MLDVGVMLGVVLAVCVVSVLWLLKAAKRLPEWVCDHGVSVGVKGMLAGCLMVLLWCCLVVLYGEGWLLWFFVVCVGYA